MIGDLRRPGDPDTRTLAGYVANIDGIRYARPGSFYTSLIECLLRADSQNRARLALAFPLLADMVTAYKTADDGLARLHAAAESGEWWSP